MSMKRNARSAFTLIELLLVMVILVVLASVVVPQFAKRRRQADITKATTDIKSLETAVSAFEIDCGRFPTNEEGLAVLVNNPNQNGWHGPYVKLLQNDPWGTPYFYEAPGTHLPDSFDLSSYGPDQHEGSDDDIVNWRS